MTSHSRVPALDGVRALAIGAVLAYHLLRHHHAGGGWLGVDVFFVLSGFLITRLLLAERERTGRIAILAFYGRRVRRLYPALLLAVLLGAVVVRLGAARPRFYPGHALYALTYTQDVATLRGWGHGQGLLSHTWSLAVEEHFYLLWPLVLVWVAGRGRRAVALTAGAGALTCFAVMQVRYAPGHGLVLPRVYYRPDARSAALLVGCLAGALPPLRVARWATPALVVLAATVAVSPEPHGRAAFALAMPAVWLSTGVLLLGVTSGRSAAATLLSWRPAVWFGSISYGVYLYHPLVGAVATHEHWSHLPAVLVTLGLATALAQASYVLVERPVLRLSATGARGDRPRDRRRPPGSRPARQPSAPRPAARCA